MKYYHRLISQEDTHEIKLTESRYLLGRGSQCDIKLTSKTSNAISRVHAFLTLDRDRYIIHDGNPETGKPSGAGMHLWNKEQGKWEKRLAAVLENGDRIMFLKDCCYLYLRTNFDASGELHGTDPGSTFV